MDFFLAKVTQQAMNYAIRSGIAITSGYAISQCSRLLKTKGGRDKDELQELQRRLESKIRIISPAIDMIELITARGNTSLESAVSLTKSLRWEIQALGVRLAHAAADEELSRKKSSKAKTQAQRDADLRLVIGDIRRLLDRIEDAVPLISLAITTSGVSLTTNLPASISPSRLLQASTFLSAGDANFGSDPTQAAQIGPTFTLSMYMLFSGHTHRPQDEEGFRNTTWKEVIHKARVKLVRTSIARVDKFPCNASKFNEEPGIDSDAHADKKEFQHQIPGNARSDEFAYQLMVVEDLDDNRVHTFEDDELQPGPFDDVKEAGIREVLPIHQVSKIFYADTGKILNIGNNDERNNPVLLLKRDINASPPRRMMDNAAEENLWDYGVDTGLSDGEGEDEDDQGVDEASELAAQFERETSVQAESSFENPWCLPPGLDPEWIALEVYTEDPESDSESETAADDASNSPLVPKHSSRQGSLDPSITSALSDLHLGSPPADQTYELAQTPNQLSNSSLGTFAGSVFAASGIRTSLSLLEMLIRLTSLQQFQQASHLTITDELLNFFLEESSTTGAAPGDVDARKQIRMDARQRVGFDPYDESPIKRRGEQYQYHGDETDDPAYRNVSSPHPAQDQNEGVSLQSPLLLPSQEHSSGSRSSGPRVTPPSTGHKHGKGNLVTPPGTNKSRAAFTKHEAARAVKMPSSPLSRTNP